MRFFEELVVAYFLGHPVDDEAVVATYIYVSANNARKEKATKNRLGIRPWIMQRLALC